VVEVAWALEARCKTHRWLLARRGCVYKLKLGQTAMEMGMGIFPSETVCCTARLQGGSDGGSWWVKQVGNWTCGRHGCSVTTSVARADGERGCHGGLIVLARAHD
jgi:hypothetical protein